MLPEESEDLAVCPTFNAKRKHEIHNTKQQ